MKLTYINELPKKTINELQTAFKSNLINLGYDSYTINEEMEYFTDSKIIDICDSVSPELINKYLN